VLTLIVGGAGAWLTGRAIAHTWRPWWIAALWMGPLAAAVRFLQAALFNGRPTAPLEAIVALVVLMLIAAAGHRRTRARQMSSRYDWLFAAAGPLSWRAARPDR
jgi:hypothetical protein